MEVQLNENARDARNYEHLIKMERKRDESSHFIVSNLGNTTWVKA